MGMVPHLWKADIDSAFRRVPVKPEDRWLCGIAFMVDGQVLICVSASAAVILFVMGSGPVRGFSITLGLGIITSVFTAIFVTRLLIVMWFERRRPKAIEV